MSEFILEPAKMMCGCVMEAIPSARMQKSVSDTMVWLSAGDRFTKTVITGKTGDHELPIKNR